jgi:hypothetical protein
MDEPAKVPSGIVLSPEQVKSRKARNIAIGLAIGFMVVLFYVVTIVKLGPDILKTGM